MRRLGLTFGVLSLSFIVPSWWGSARANEDDAAQQGVKPDNTTVNKRDANPNEPTADQQSNSMSDVQLTAKIRRAVMKNKTLSMNGHNVKIIVEHGNVTLKGPVASADEKTAIEHTAVQIAGRDRVKCELSVKQ